MVLRKKNSPPPIEIMRRRQELAAQEPVTSSDLVREKGSGEGSRGLGGGMSVKEMGESLLERARYPLVIRLPRAFAFLLGVVLLCVIFLAYMAGQARGRSAEREMRQEMQAQLIDPMAVFNDGQYLDDQRSGVTGADARSAGMRRNGLMVVEQPGSVGRGDEGNTANSGRDGAGAGVRGTGGAGVGSDVGGTGGGGEVGRGDPRVPGMNYFALMSYSPEHAQRLIEFLGEHGVEAAAVPGHNAGLAKVVAMRAFTAEQTRSPQREAYEQYLRRLGRAWKARNGNKGDDLRLMYLELYDP